MKRNLPKTETDSDRVVVVVRTDCPACLDVVKNISLEMQPYHRQPRVINLDWETPFLPQYDSVITPAIFIDQQLWAYGSVDRQVLNDRLAALGGESSKNRF